MVLSTTIWASFYWHLLLFIVVAFVVAIVMVRQNLPFVAENKSHSDQTAYSKLTIYSSLKCHVICSTIAMILAVDFPIFPREFAKTERFGLSIMDVGAIFFVALNSAVSIEIRCEQYLKGWSAMIKTIKSCLPLITIGLIRLVVVKALDYHESVSEYGVHLNFFLLLAIVKVRSNGNCTPLI